MARHRRKKKKDFFALYDYSGLQRTNASCPHFGECGGCSFQDIEYDSQVILKQDYLRSLFNQDIVIEPATQELEYRNRMDFVYAFGELGLRKKGDFKTLVPISNCLLFPKPCQDVFVKLKELLKKENIESYDFLKHSGFLRYVVFRFAPSTGELMLIFTSASPSVEQEEALHKVFVQLEKELTSIYWLINDSLTDVSLPFVQAKEIIGKEYITEKIAGVSLLISPFSFFQANTRMAQLIFQKIKDRVHGETIDLCCGVGTIALLVADKAKSVLGIEEVKDAVNLANKNRENNNVSNVLFFAAGMKRILDYAPLHVDTLIVDPPRAGLEKKVIKRILELEPEQILYMSCNPKTQKIDLDLIAESNIYELISIEGFDMFAQTTHVETLVVLKRKLFDGL